MKRNLFIPKSSVAKHENGVFEIPVKKGEFRKIEKPSKAMLAASRKAIKKESGSKNGRTLWDFIHEGVSAVGEGVGTVAGMVYCSTQGPHC